MPLPSQPSPTKTGTSLFTLFGGAVFAVVAIVLVLGGIRHGAQRDQLAKDVDHFSETPGVVTYSNIHHADSTYQLDIAFEYTVDGVKYRGSNADTAYPTTHDAAMASAKGILGGAAITVYYDPAKPSRSVMTKTFPAASKAPPPFLLSAAIFAVVVGFFIIATRRRVSREATLLQDWQSQNNAVPACLAMPTPRDPSSAGVLLAGRARWLVYSTIGGGIFGTLLVVPMILQQTSGTAYSRIIPAVLVAVVYVAMIAIGLLGESRRRDLFCNGRVFQGKILAVRGMGKGRVVDVAFDCDGAAMVGTGGLLGNDQSMTPGGTVPVLFDPQSPVRFGLASPVLGILIARVKPTTFPGAPV